MRSMTCALSSDWSRARASAGPVSGAASSSSPSSSVRSTTSVSVSAGCVPVGALGLGEAGPGEPAADPASPPVDTHRYVNADNLAQCVAEELCFGFELAADGGRLERERHRLGVDRADLRVLL